MSQKLYRHVLRDAWTVTWRHPALWIFGAFAIFMGQSQFFYSLGGLFQMTSFGRSAAGLASQSREWFLPVVSPNSWAQVAIGLLVSILIIAIAGLFSFMVIQSQGAVMAAGDYIFRKRLYSFKASWHAALEHFWAILGVMVVKLVAAMVIFMGIFGIQELIARLPDSWLAKGLFILGFVVLALLDILITFVALYTTCYIVLEKQRFGSALQHAVNLFAKHWLASIEIGVIFLVANILMAIVIQLVFAILFVPLFYFAVLMKVATGLVAPIAVVNILVLFGAVWVVASIYTTWFYMAVVVLFDHMVSDTPVSKIIRFVRSIVSRRG